MKDTWRTIRLPFDTRLEIALSLSVALNYLLAAGLILVLFVHAPGLNAAAFWAGLGLAILIGTFLGLAVRRGLCLHPSGWLRSGGALLLLGAVIGLFPAGCLDCAANQGAPAGPIAGAASMYPLGGLEFKIVAGIVAAFALGLISRRSALGFSRSPEEVESADSPPESAGGRGWLRQGLIAGSMVAVLVLLPAVLGARSPWTSPDAWISEQDKADNPPWGASDGYALNVAFGDLGPRLIDAGVIDQDALTRLYEQGGSPLTASQQSVLLEGSRARVVLRPADARFLLHFFWALGLANRNPILTEGPMWMAAEGNIGRFASTGGWTLGTRPAAELYGSIELLPLETEEQARLEAVAANVYRPCCNNPALFPDCNHGMAMLGMLTLLAAEGASTEEMFEAAKMANALWFPAQAARVDIFLQSALDTDFANADAQLAVGPEVFSASGFAAMNGWLAQNGLLGPSPNKGSGCGI